LWSRFRANIGADHPAECVTAHPIEPAALLPEQLSAAQNLR
jgi:hypothetical protein